MQQQHGFNNATSLGSLNGYSTNPVSLVRCRQIGFMNKLRLQETEIVFESGHQAAT